MSCGIDFVPFKVCTLDCIYCQLGKTAVTTIERKPYLPTEPVLTELKEALSDGLKADYITLAGSGEPTLNSNLGRLIDGIKKITDIPVAILTNGTLLYRKDVREDCKKADVVMPSLDAVDEQTFLKINHPNSIISIKKLISGLCTFREEFSGQIWLEVFLVEGINTSPDQIARIKVVIDKIKPDKIHLNTAVRPTADPDVLRLSNDKLENISLQFGPKCEVVADFLQMHSDKSNSNITEKIHDSNILFNRTAKSILSMLKRRPSSLDDVCTGLGIHRNEAQKYIIHLRDNGLIQSEEKDGKLFFKA